MLLDAPAPVVGLEAGLSRTTIEDGYRVRYASGSSDKCRHGPTTDVARSPTMVT
jgi:hypothetical protein